MSNLRDLLIVQYGVEVASDDFGSTAATQTIKLMTIDSFQINPVERSIQIGERRGSLAPAHADVRTIQEASASLGGLINYTDMDWILDGAFGECASDDTAWSQDSDTSVVTKVYKAPLSTYDTDLSAVPTYTICEGEADAASNAYSIFGAVVNSIGFTFEDGAAGRFVTQFIGHHAGDDELDALNDRTTVVAMGDHVTLYVDPASDAAGSGTALSATAYRIELNVSLNRRLNRHLGSVFPSGYKDHKWSGTMRIVMEMTATTRAFLDDMLADGSAGDAIEKVVRVKAATGAAATTRSLQIDFNGVILDAPTLHTDDDGITTVEMLLTGQYNSVLANWLVITTENATE
jgi:hypothetical protein